MIKRVTILPLLDTYRAIELYNAAPTSIGTYFRLCNVQDYTYHLMLRGYCASTATYFSGWPETGYDCGQQSQDDPHLYEATCNGTSLLA